MILQIPAAMSFRSPLSWEPNASEMESYVLCDLVHRIGSELFCYAELCVDSGWRRERAAKRIQQYAADVKAGIDDRHALQQMVDAAESSYRFERCYALGTLGELGERAEPALPVIIEGLKDSDGFVRHAAAQALYDMGRSAAGARDELITTLRKFPHHSSGMYAAQALGEIGDRSPEVLDALRFAGAKQQSLSTKSARKAYVKLTGEDLAEVSERDVQRRARFSSRIRI